MSVKSIDPYIHLNGTADQAIRLYESALRAKTECVIRYGDVPGMNTPPEQKDRVMHALLRIGAGAIMLSDSECGKNSGTPAPEQPNVHIALDYAAIDEMTKAFQALADNGGRVVFPLHDTFWGAKFGVVTDLYGVHWKFNCDVKKGEA